MADEDPTETDATKRANRQYDWFTSQFANPRTFGYPIGEPTFDSPPVAEERAPGVGERAPGPGARATAVAEPPAEVAGPPAPLSGPPDAWGVAAASEPGKEALNATTGERWFSDGTQWSRVGRQTASTGEPGEAGAPYLPAPQEFAAAPSPAPAVPPGPLGPGLPAPKGFLEEPVGGWDPTATAPNAGLARGAYAALTGSPPAAGSVLMDEAGRSLENMKREQDVQKIVVAAKDAATEQARAKQAAAIEKVKAASADYVAYLENTKQPVPPELQKSPPKPDVKIRPWLDPEGKDAISVIVQTLGMMAVGAAGLTLKAPMTAMTYFREAAEAWRRDEVDQANSKLKQFEMTMTGIKNDNELALKQYEIADKQYAHNIDAKKAMVAGQLDQLNLSEKAVELISKPYEEALAASKTQFDQSAKILDEVAKLQKVGVDLAKLHQEGLPKTIAGAEIILADSTRKLAEMDAAGTPPSDPTRVPLQRQHDLAEQILQTHQQRMTVQNQESFKQKAAGKEIELATEQLRQANFYERRIEQLADAYQILHEENKLPTSRTLVARWVAHAKQNWAAYSPRAQGAIATIERVMNPATIGIDRTYFNEKGNVAQKAWGKIDTEFIPIDEANSALSILASVTHEARQRATDTITTRVRMLGEVTPRDFDTTAPLTGGEE